MDITEHIVPSTRKNKYAAYAENGHVCYELTCIKDGSTQKFWDDGPFERDPDTGKKLAGWNLKPANPKRQHLLAVLRKKDEAGNPIFFAKSPLPPVWNKANQEWREVPVLNDKIAAAHAEHMGQHKQLLEEAATVFKAKVNEAQANADAAAQSKLVTPTGAVKNTKKDGAA